jgi:hypothetical protein
MIVLVYGKYLEMILGGIYNNFEENTLLEN